MPMQIVASLQSLGAGEIADAEVRKAERQVSGVCIAAVSLPRAAILL